MSCCCACNDDVSGLIKLLVNGDIQDVTTMELWDGGSIENYGQFAGICRFGDDHSLSLLRQECNVQLVSPSFGIYKFLFACCERCYERR